MAGLGLLTISFVLSSGRNSIQTKTGLAYKPEERIVRRIDFGLDIIQYRIYISKLRPYVKNLDKKTAAHAAVFRKS